MFCAPDTTWSIKTLCDVCQFTMKVLRTATPPAHRGEGSRAPVSLPFHVRWAAEPSLCLVVSAPRTERIHSNWNKYFCTARVRPRTQNFETIFSAKLLSIIMLSQYIHVMDSYSVTYNFDFSKWSPCTFMTRWNNFCPRSQLSSTLRASNSLPFHQSIHAFHSLLLLQSNTSLWMTVLLTQPQGNF